MWDRTRRIVTTVVAVSAFLVAAAPAMAQEAPTADPADRFEAARNAVIDQIGQRSDRLAERLGLLEEARIRLGSLSDEAGAASTPEELRAAVEAARTDLTEIRDRGREAAYDSLTAHVAADVIKFTERADRLGIAIENAASSGIDTSAAEAELTAAYGDLAAAGAMVSDLPPDLGDDPAGSFAAARDAHGVAHQGQAHVRAAFALLQDAGGVLRPHPGVTTAL